MWSLRLGIYNDADTGWWQAVAVPDHFDNFGADNPSIAIMVRDNLCWPSTACDTDIVQPFADGAVFIAFKILTKM